MKRTNAQPLSEVLKDFMMENPQLERKMSEIHVMNAWTKVLGTLTQKYTTGMYIKAGVLHVKISSPVLRNELIMCRERLVKSLNENAGGDIIHDIVITG